MKRTTIVAALTTLALSACGDKPASFDDLEQAKGVARENATFNAQTFRRDNQVLYPGWQIISEGDSSQMPNCPMGDGWATLKLVAPDGGKVLKLKCSTFSANTACVSDAEFKTKPFASEDGRWGKDRVPYPLPKIAR